MNKIRKLFSSGNKGFTLVELIVVIAVLGILAGIAVPRLTGVQDKARYAAGKALLANLKTPLELYRIENGDYPSSEGGTLNYSQFENKLTDDGYLDNLASILPKTSTDGWYFSSYSYDPDNDNSYTLEIEHPKVSEKLTMTTSEISRPSD